MIQDANCSFLLIKLRENLFESFPSSSVGIDYAPTFLSQLKWIRMRLEWEMRESRDNGEEWTPSLFSVLEKLRRGMKWTAVPFLKWTELLPSVADFFSGSLSLLPLSSAPQHLSSSTLNTAICIPATFTKVF